MKRSIPILHRSKLCRVPLSSLSPLHSRPTTFRTFSSTPPFPSLFTRIKDQVYLLGFSFALCLLAGQNYNLRYKLSTLEGTTDGTGGLGSTCDTVSSRELDLLSLEMGRLVKVWVSEEITESWFRGKGTLGKEGVERVEVKVRDGVKAVFRAIKLSDVSEEEEEGDGGKKNEEGVEVLVNEIVAEDSDKDVKMI